jgi:cob(I)alamin adenosyltransferase
MAKIYTKRGDKGQSSLFGGQPVPKNDARLEAYGTLDELNSVLGLARSETRTAGPALSSLDQDLERIQNYLFTVGSHLAVGNEAMIIHLPKLDAAQTSFLEDRIDQMEESLTPLKNFILPGGTRAASLLHLARTVTRRAERATVAVTPAIEGGILAYLNRLSDYFFVAARHANSRLGQPDVLWDKNAPA